MANPDSHDMQLQLEVLAPEFSVCKMGAHDPIPNGLAERAYCFIGRTPDELSIVCESAAAPTAAAEREDGWRALKVAGPLDFGLVGILAKICQALADAAIPASVTRIGEGAFAGCGSLAQVSFDGSEEQWQTVKIGDRKSVV